MILCSDSQFNLNFCLMIFNLPDKKRKNISVSPFLFIKQNFLGLGSVAVAGYKVLETKKEADNADHTKTD